MHIRCMQKQVLAWEKAVTQRAKCIKLHNLSYFPNVGFKNYNELYIYQSWSLVYKMITH